MGEVISWQELDEILERNGLTPSSIISILQDIQEVYRYIPEEVFPYLSEKLGMSIAKIYGVATFYENFSLSFHFC